MPDHRGRASFRPVRNAATLVAWTRSSQCAVRSLLPLPPMPYSSASPDLSPAAATADAQPTLSIEQAFRLVFPGVMVTMFLAAADQTILASALPAIASTLHGVTD